MPADRFGVFLRNEGPPLQLKRQRQKISTETTATIDVRWYTAKISKRWQRNEHSKHLADYANLGAPVKPREVGK